MQIEWITLCYLIVRDHQWVHSSKQDVPNGKFAASLGSHKETLPICCHCWSTAMSSSNGTPLTIFDLLMYLVSLWCTKSFILCQRSENWPARAWMSALKHVHNTNTNIFIHWTHHQWIVFWHLLSSLHLMAKLQFSSRRSCLHLTLTWPSYCSQLRQPPRPVSLSSHTPYLTGARPLVQFFNLIRQPSKLPFWCFTGTWTNLAMPANDTAVLENLRIL